MTDLEKKKALEIRKKQREEIDDDFFQITKASEEASPQMPEGWSKKSN